MALRKAPDRAKNLLHGRRVANDFGRSSIARIRCAAGVLCLLRLGPCHGGHHFVDVEGLGQVLEGALLIGIDCAVEIGVRGGDDDGQVGLSRFNLRQQGNTVHAGHTDVADYNHRRIALQRINNGVT